MTTPSHLPTFIIGGAPRSGTTYLTVALANHPDVYMARPFAPEPKVFMGARQPLEVYHDRYRAFFAKAGDRAARGEKTSHYLGCTQSCELIHQVVPDVRMLFIVREPVARAYSNYLMTKKNGLERLPFEEAIALEGKRPSPLPPEKAYAQPYAYLSRGDYATFAQSYYETFGRDHVYFAIYEDIARRPRQLWKEIQEFLGLAELPFEKLDPGVVNSAKEVGPALDPAMEERLRERMLPLVQRFATLTGLDLEPWGYAA